MNEHTDQIVGATSYGPGAAQRIALLRFAIDEGLTVADWHADLALSPVADSHDRGAAVLLRGCRSQIRQTLDPAPLA